MRRRPTRDRSRRKVAQPDLDLTTETAHATYYFNRDTTQSQQHSEAKEARAEEQNEREIKKVENRNTPQTAFWACAYQPRFSYKPLLVVESFLFEGLKTSVPLKTSDAAPDKLVPDPEIKGEAPDDPGYI
ncbi:hypothetical protein KQX54_007850 [Cotesia glomerata]|uniref:Uncharacterized protein n=1 Tax=Cotesia glomerata TaxID=32391 RepID=A0AAV7IZ76_COTGL|nr:hypothetical protein KQX54_007850 [Cotesia glomerata]